jgi:glycosyltransferase involved in cell wall biosynthesis
MPVYNGERYIGEALDSLLGQTFTDFELVICDNASSDGTEDICRSYVEKEDRIRYVRNERNIGAARNYTKAFKLSRGEYFRWANHDDLAGPDALALCLSILERDPSVVLAYTKTKLIDGNGRVVSEYEDGLHLASFKPRERFRQFFRNVRLVNVPYGLIRSEAIRKTGMIGSYIASDIIFLAELSLHGRFWEVPEYQFYRRIHPDAYSSRKDTKHLVEFYNPTNTDSIPMTNWKNLLEMMRAVNRSSLGKAEKVRLLLYTGRILGLWRRSQLAGELYAGARNALHRI